MLVSPQPSCAPAMLAFRPLDGLFVLSRKRPVNVVLVLSLDIHGIGLRQVPVSLIMMKSSFLILALVEKLWLPSYSG